MILENIHAKTSFQPFFSDGAASQFKQKYNFNVNLTNLQEQGVTVHWHFVATSQCKGAVDGVGGDVKRMAWLERIRFCVLLNVSNVSRPRTQGSRSFV